jgi:hypothetical protein
VGRFVEMNTAKQSDETLDRFDQEDQKEKDKDDGL